MFRYIILRFLAVGCVISGAAMLYLCAVLFLSHRYHNIDWNEKARPFDDITIARDIPYATGDRHSLDVYYRNIKGAKRPTIVFFYGGTWIAGKKEEVAYVGASLARLGYVAIVPDYRIYPHAHWPSFLQENAAAVRWAYDHAAEFGGDPRDLILMGHSAGAFNALSLAIDHRWLAQQELDPIRDIAAVIGIAGPYRMYPDTPPLWDVLGPKAQLPDIWPVNHVDGHAPPALLIVGGRDDIAGSGDSRELAEKIAAAGGKVTLRSFRFRDHDTLLSTLIPQKGKKSDEVQAIETFISAHRPVVSALSAR